MGKKRTKITNVRYREDITTDPIGVKRVREVYELFASRFENLHEMCKFLERYTTKTDLKEMAICLLNKFELKIKNLPIE